MTDPLDHPRVTIIVTQRERFGMTAESLENLYANTATPFRLVYVDGRSPRRHAEYLRQEAASRGFDLIRREQYLSPNRARNIGLDAASTEYVVFVDNDVLYTPGWLDALIACADETGAAVVAPLICHAFPEHQIIHHAGGDYVEPERFEAFHQKLTHEPQPFYEAMHGHNCKVAEWKQPLERQKTGFCEFHCVLARRDAFDRIGPLDEAMLSTKEHIDFSMAIAQAGGEVWFEPTSVVTYIFPNRQRALEWTDWTFFCLRWSDAYGRRTLEHFLGKWRLEPPPNYIAEKRAIYSHRRYQAILVPLMRKLPLVAGRDRLAAALARVASVFERQINKLVVARHG